jgi:hypothetical protein
VAKTTRGGFYITQELVAEGLGGRRDRDRGTYGHESHYEEG